ncbi:MAG: GAF domain-containing protein [Anaerolineae bacterium]|nr:GAF domain-containing protein [Anaerolineae bacterium]
MSNIHTPQDDFGTVEIWRQHLIRNFLRVMVVLGIPVVIFAVYWIYLDEVMWQAPIPIGVYLVLCIMAYWRKASYKVQVLSLIAVFGVFGLFNQMQYGFNSESALILSSAVLLASLFFGRRMAQFTMLAISLALLVIAWGFTSGHLVVFYPGTTVPRDTKWVGWILYIVLFVGLNTAMQYAQGYLMARLGDALARSRSLAHDLEAERAGLAEQVTIRTRAAEQARHEAEAAAAALQAQMWLVAGQAQLSAVLRGEKDLPSLAQAVLAEVCRYVGASVGALYLRDGDAVWLLGRYSYTPAPGQLERFHLGEGWVGQVAQEGRLQLLADIPESQLILASGLGETPLRHLLAAPFAYMGVVSGVLELGSLHAFTESHVQFVEQSLEPIAIAFNTARSHAHITTLLEETQRQADALSVREEELRAINEQLQAQAENSQGTRTRRL